MASSTNTATFDMTRTTGTVEARCFSTNEVRTPAAKLTTRCSDVTWSATCPRRASISCGLTVSTTVWAHSTASGVGGVAATPVLFAQLAGSLRRTGGDHDPVRVSPTRADQPGYQSLAHLAAAEERDPPSHSSSFLDSSPSPYQVRQEEPHIGRSLGQSPGQVGIPFGAVGDVHAHGVSVLREATLKIAPDPEQHLELEARPRNTATFHEPLRPLDQTGIVGGDVHAMAQVDQPDQAPGERGVHLPPSREGDLRWFQVRPLHQSDDRVRGKGPDVGVGPVQRTLQAQSEPIVADSQVTEDGQGPVDVRAALHVDHHHGTSGRCCGHHSFHL